MPLALSTTASRIALLAALLASKICVVKARQSCEDDRWKRLQGALNTAYHHSDYDKAFSADVFELTQPENFQWYKTNYQDCVEGLLSLVLYLSLHSDEHRRGLLIDLASRTARELNPLALRKGLTTWPLFGLLHELNLVWQSGDPAAPLATEPLRQPPCEAPVPGIISPLLTALRGSGLSPLRLMKNLGPGSLIIDAGVFDGTDWSLAGVLSGATVIGFEPLPENHAVFEDRFPDALEKELIEANISIAATGRPCKHYTLLPVTPGGRVPRTPWAEVFPPLHCQADSGQADSPVLGHTFVIGAALGEQVRDLKMLTRYDYSSIADQGYLTGPPDMEKQDVAMVTLDHIVGEYLAPSGRAPGAAIDVLKLDVEGYEMGALRGAERLLSEGRVHYLVLEFHPGMLGSTGTDPRGLLEFLQHYCFICHSMRIDRPHNFTEFVARYTSSTDVLPMQGLGALEDLLCQNLHWRPPTTPFAASQDDVQTQSGRW